MVNRSLNRSLKPDSLLEDIVAIFRHVFHTFNKKLLECLFDIFNIPAAILNNIHTGAIVKDGKEHMLQTDIFMTPSFGLSHRETESSAKLFIDHGFILSP